MAPKNSRIPLHGSIQLVIRLGRGNVVVTERDDVSEASVKLTSRDPNSDIVDRFTVDMQNSTLAIIGPRQGGIFDLVNRARGERDAVDVEVEVPTGTPVKVVSASADVTVNGQCGDADIATGAATITLDDVNGDFRLRGGSVEAHVQRAHGAAVVRAGSGTAHFGDVEGLLECGFGSGQVTASTARGGVKVRAGAGSAEIGATYGDVDVAFGSGSIHVGVPTGIPARVDVTSGSGQVRSDIVVEKAPTSAGETITIRARTGAGAIQLSRAVSAA